MKINKIHKSKTILIYSGGLDSTVLLYYFLNLKNNVKCLSINYGQKHKKEIEIAKYFCKKLHVEHEIVDISNITKLISSSSLTSDLVVPDGHYEEESMKSTVVPNRNMIMLSIAIGWAINEKYNSVSYAAHSGDHAIYPDCRNEFVENLSSAAKLADWHPIEINRPFINMSKTEIIKLGNKLGIELEKTWSCYKGKEYHCGTCGTCNERIESFNLASIEDKTIYEKN